MKRGFADLLEARHDVTGDGADQRRDIIHETLREAVLPGRLQSLGEIQVVDDALHLRWKTGVKLVVTGTKKSTDIGFLFFRLGTVTYHEFEEKPGLLQGPFPHTSTAHHPLKSQLFMEELGLVGRGKGKRSECYKAEDTENTVTVDVRC